MDSVTPSAYLGDMAKLACPECGSTEVIPIVYGMPDWDLHLASERGEVAIGGCIVIGDDPTHQCRACGHEFRRPSRTRR